MAFSTEETVLVTIENDTALVSAFLQWGLDNRVYSIRGGGSSRGLSHVFAAEDGPAIKKFLNDWNNK